MRQYISYSKTSRKLQEVRREVFCNILNRVWGTHETNQFD
jgi:hypothetical protein